MFLPMITYVSLFEKSCFYQYLPKVVRNQQKASLYVTPKYHQPFPPPQRLCSSSQR